ncbi:MAG: hypothetical protein K2L23_05635, partial [Odoribacter sp.]|nr:hypothetical protein [Odoribacter sp.]
PLHMYSIVQLKSLAKGLIVNMDHVSEAVLSVLEKKIQAFLGMEQKGEIYPDGNCVSVNCKGYIARWAVYPFFNYYSRCVV